MVGPDTILDDEAEAVPFTELLLVVDPYDGVDPDLVDYNRFTMKQMSLISALLKSYQVNVFV